MDTDGLVLYQQSISGYCAEYAPMQLNLLVGENSLPRKTKTLPYHAINIMAAEVTGCPWISFISNTFHWHMICHITLQWHHYECDGASNHQRLNCFLNCLFRRRSKNTSKLCVTGLCVGNSRVTGEFPTHRASNVENISIWKHHHDIIKECVLQSFKCICYYLISYDTT